MAHPVTERLLIWVLLGTLVVGLVLGYFGVLG